MKPAPWDNWMLAYAQGPVSPDADADAPTAASAHTLHLDGLNPEQRCLARVEPYELAANALEAGLDINLSPLALDYQSRMNRWANDHESEPQRADGSSPQAPQYQPEGQPWSSPLIFACGILALAGPVCLLLAVASFDSLANLRWAGAVIIVSPLLAVGCALIALSLFKITLGNPAPRSAHPRLGSGTQSKALRPANALPHRRCPSCGCELGQSRSVFIFKHNNLQSGPRTCPACHCAWPLVPPKASAVRVEISL